ncbi:hypothetical protein SUGI_0534160 [Cryptomeria japonica]|nr:hypothetical protein SUGI_0534160 [Cryptomeria japonica]
MITNKKIMTRSKKIIANNKIATHRLNLLALHVCKLNLCEVQVYNTQDDLKEEDDEIIWNYAHNHHLVFEIIWKYIYY